MDRLFLLRSVRVNDFSDPAVKSDAGQWYYDPDVTFVEIVYLKRGEHEDIAH